jgi:hypothetical protein
MSIAGRKGYVPDGIRDDTCRGMQLLGDVFDHFRSLPSELELYQVCVMPGMR